jgi:uncharacterized protein YaeQ
MIGQMSVGLNIAMRPSERTARNRIFGLKFVVHLERQCRFNQGIGESGQGQLNLPVDV